MATTTAVGQAGGAVAERVVNEENRSQPIVVADARGRRLAGPASGSDAPVETFRVSSATLECELTGQVLEGKSSGRGLGMDPACNDGQRASVRIDLRPEHGGPSTLDVVADTRRPDRRMSCTGTFRHKSGQAEPFGLICREVYRAPCAPEPATCVGDVGESMRIQSSRRRSRGAVAIEPVAAGRERLRVWMDPLS